jgi:uncharacterized protein YbjT (DUF2867 family)
MTGVLVFGGTGKVGSAAVRRLAQQGQRVRVFTRSPEKVAALGSGAESFTGDLDASDDLGPAFDGIDRVILILGVHPHEQARGLAVVAAAAKAAVAKIVFLSLVQGPWSESIPFYKSKLPIEAAIRESGMRWAVVRSASYFQTDAGLKSDILDKGLFTAPIGSKGVNRIDTRDVGHAMAEAVLGDCAGDVPIFGPETLTGPSVAATYSRVLSRPVQYAGDDLAAWAALKKDAFNPWQIAALSAMYGYIQREGMVPPPGYPKPAILPAQQVRFEDYARELAKSWGVGA